MNTIDKKQNNAQKTKFSVEEFLLNLNKSAVFPRYCLTKEILNVKLHFFAYWKQPFTGILQNVNANKFTGKLQFSCSKSNSRKI